MFINKTASGANNICGKNVCLLRKRLGISQRALADRLQIQGLDVDKNAIQRIEAGKRVVTDIELCSLAMVFGKSVDELLRHDIDITPATKIHAILSSTDGKAKDFSNSQSEYI